MNFYEWFTTFCIEKGWYNSVEDHALNDLPKDEQEYMHIGFDLHYVATFIQNTPFAGQVKNQFVLLDFKNADCRDYLRHLINGIMISQGFEAIYEVKHAA